MFRTHHDHDKYRIEQKKTLRSLSHPLDQDYDWKKAFNEKVIDENKQNLHFMTKILCQNLFIFLVILFFEIFQWKQSFLLLSLLLSY